MTTTADADNTQPRVVEQPNVFSFTVHATLSPNFNHLYIAVPAVAKTVKLIATRATLVIRFFIDCLLDVISIANITS